MTEKKRTKTGERGRGRPTKLNPLIEEQVARLFKMGLTDAEVSHGLKIARSTLSKWKKDNPNFSDTIKKSKAIADARVERSLFERACGYSHPEDKIFLHEGVPIIVKTTKHYPPDTGAGAYWTKNRDPKRWKDKQVVEINEDRELIDEIAEEIKEHGVGKIFSMIEKAENETVE